MITSVIEQDTMKKNARKAKEMDLPNPLKVDEKAFTDVIDKMIASEPVPLKSVTGPEAPNSTEQVVLLAMPGWLGACQEGWEKTALQPLPAPDQAVSDQPRGVLEVVRLVPPTAVTQFEDAGNATPPA